MIIRFAEKYIPALIDTDETFLFMADELYDMCPELIWIIAAPLFVTLAASSVRPKAAVYLQLSIDGRKR